MRLKFYRHTKFHIVTPQRVILIMHYNPTLCHIAALAVWTRTLAEGVHQGIPGSLTIRTTPTHLRSINNTATHFTYLGRMEG